MNSTEKRRRKLLEQTRNLYSEHRTVPAIHPRYKAAYHQVYDDDCEMQTGSLGLRTAVCLLIFFVYAAMEYSGSSILGITNMQVLENIMHNIV